MTHLCYTLQEASEKLKLTETVLVRLSQYFKVPRSAYEASGYLSFKGDLSFTEPDIDFFRQAKERLVQGESLDTIKNRIREQEPLPVQSGYPAAPPESTHRDRVTPPKTEFSAAVLQPLAASEPMREIQDREPYEKAVEASFERYKSIHRTGLGRVFENMLKEVGVTRSDDKKPDAIPDFRPLRPKTTQHATRPSVERLLPFQKAEAPQSPESVSKSTQAKRTQTPSMEPSWEQLLKQATHQPRTLNSHLKGAAALLRERATGQMSRLDPSSR
ncbi:hypothetical protein [Vampirovibrio sp.]|uniref:hypothetical protein n=1 Tax=Vampirovibrio sp. TaxID=2717857 RepID=UPI003592EF96